MKERCPGCGEMTLERVVVDGEDEVHLHCSGDSCMYRRVLKRGDYMKPGRELDALVAEKVMGLKVETRWQTEGRGSWSDPIRVVDVPVHPMGGFPDFGTEVKHYSTDIGAAWEVVEKIGLAVVPFPEFKKWWAYDNGDAHFDERWWHEVKISPEHDGIADTAPHAICLAALKAVGVDLPPARPR